MGAVGNFPNQGRVDLSRISASLSAYSPTLREQAVSAILRISARVREMLVYVSPDTSFLKLEREGIFTVMWESFADCLVILEITTEQAPLASELEAFVVRRDGGLHALRSRNRHDGPSSEFAPPGTIFSRNVSESIHEKRNAPSAQLAAGVCDFTYGSVALPIQAAAGLRTLEPWSEELCGIVSDCSLCLRTLEITLYQWIWHFAGQRPTELCEHESCSYRPDKWLLDGSLDESSQSADINVRCGQPTIGWSADGSLDGIDTNTTKIGSLLGCREGLHE